MDPLTLSLTLLTATLTAVTWMARRMGNEPRDVALLGVSSGLLGLGTAVSAIV